MTLEPDKQLLHYRVVEKLGEGGMGEVWKATDTTLDRTVAIKVLPAALADDAERLARFEREAKTLAALNHPNIAGLYGLHEADGLRFISMEFVEGEDLAARLERGALPMDEAVGIAQTIAAALGAAHSSGIVHRDLKPANVMLTPAGEPKVLDFGLAKAVAPDAASGSSASVSMSPTVTSLGTVAGVILGTAAYMSPEQARGKPVDRRSDLWSFGAMLYEMLTGVRLFGGGETISDTMASVLKNDPDWEVLPASTPAGVRRLLKRCLQRDPKHRLHDADDARLELEQAFDEEMTGAETPAASPVARIALIGALALIAGLAIGYFVRGGGPTPTASVEERPVVTSILSPPGTRINVDQLSISLSPEGDQLAFIGVDQQGLRELYVRRLDSGDVRKLSGTGTARTPFWSPDSKEIGFFVGTRLMRVPADGGTPQLIAEVDGEFGSWNEDDTIIFSVASEIKRVDARGGAVETLDLEATGPTGSASSLGSVPQFLPDGQHFIYEILMVKGPGSGIYLGKLGSTEAKLLIEVRSNGFYADGKLLYVKDGQLMAHRFDLETHELAGDAVRIAGPVLRLNYPFHGLFTSSADGSRIVYLPGDETTGISEIVWVDRSGNELERTGIRGDLYNPRLSPDGRRLAIDVSTHETHGDIWIFDLVRGSERRLTSDPIDESEPTWTPDGKKVLFFRIPDLYEVDASGGEPRLIHESQAESFTSDVSPDGRFALIVDFVDNQSDILVLDLETGETRPWLVGPTDDREPRFSPDGKWVAYDSTESGRLEVYVDRFPDRGERFQLSDHGGREAIWRPDGKELFYYSQAGDIVAVPVDMSSDADPIGKPEKLFSAGYCKGTYDVTADGQRFLLNQSIQVNATEMVLLQNRQAP